MIGSYEVLMKQIARQAMRSLLWLSVVSVTIVLSGCGAPAGKATSKLAFDDCRLKHVESQARCTYFEVPEDHANVVGNKIKIHVAVLPALTKNAERDPVFFFAGGPGQAASEIGNLVEALSPLRRNRDIVLVDQRGTGKSKTLSCEAGSLENTAIVKRNALIEAFNSSEAQMAKEWRNCIATLKGNAGTHRTDDYIADLELIRKALGYDKINVWGGSYGSRVALRYMKLHPNVIRSSVIDGVAPTTLRLPNDALINSENELRAVFAACEASPSCAKAYPGIAKTLDDLLASLRQSPRVVKINHPADGKSFDATITNVSFATLLWPLLYQPEATRMLPTLITEAASGNYAPFAAMMLGSSVSDTQIALAQRFAVMCAEDMSGQKPGGSDRMSAVATMFFSFCADFPAGKVVAEFFEPTTSAIPTLLLSGMQDPVTPPSQGDLAKKTLSNSKHIVLDGFGHIVSPHPCARRIIKKFVDEGTISAAIDTCESDLKFPRPLFYTSTLEAK
jgi:pimeloyl-ACP methyl ester carboxylesterase